MYLFLIRLHSQITKIPRVHHALWLLWRIFGSKYPLTSQKALSQPSRDYWPQTQPGQTWQASSGHRESFQWGENLQWGRPRSSPCLSHARFWVVHRAWIFWTGLSTFVHYCSFYNEIYSEEINFTATYL